MFVIITVNNNVTSFEIKDHNVAMEAVRRRVDALSRSKLAAKVEVYAGREHICNMCREGGDDGLDSVYGGYCSCLSLQDQWLAEWSSDKGWNSLDHLHRFINAWNDRRDAAKRRAEDERLAQANAELTKAMFLDGMMTQEEYEMTLSQ